MASTLAARLDAVLASGDKANVFAHWEAGERLDAEAKRIKEEEQEAAKVAALAGRLQSGVRTAAQAGANRRMARFRVAG